MLIPPVTRTTALPVIRTAIRTRPLPALLRAITTATITTTARGNTKATALPYHRCRSRTPAARRMRLRRLSWPRRPVLPRRMKARSAFPSCPRRCRRCRTFSRSRIVMGATGQPIRNPFPSFAAPPFSVVPLPFRSDEAPALAVERAFARLLQAVPLRPRSFHRPVRCVLSRLAGADFA